MQESVSSKPKLMRTATVALSLDVLLKGQLAYLNQHFDVIAVSGNDQHLQHVNEREQVVVRDVNMPRAISPIQDIIALVKLYRLFKTEKPTIVHSITPKAGLLSMLAGKAAGVPIRVHTFTGLMFPTKTGALQKLLIKMDQLLCWAATHIYPEGNGVKNDLIRFNITKKPLNIIANGNVNGIDSSYFDPSLYNGESKNQLRDNLKIPRDAFVFIFVGRLVTDKGINELIAAFKNVVHHQPDATIRLLLVGPLETQLDPLLPETLTEIATNAQICSVGFQNDVRPYFALANCLVFPSYREGFPNVVLQAGAMGLASIVTDINGCNEIIEHDRNGIIIPPKDVSAIESAMNRCITDKEFLEKACANARELITQRFEQQIVWSAMLQEYNLILKNSRLVLHE